jgi:hypothetical protein
MMTTLFASGAVYVGPGRGEDPMPARLAGSDGTFSFDGVGQRHRSRSDGEVGFVLSTHPRKVASQAVHHGIGQDGALVFLPLPSSKGRRRVRACAPSTGPTEEQLERIFAE